MKFHPLLLSIALLSLVACDGKPTESNQSQTDAAPSHHAAADAQHTPETEKQNAMPAPSAADVGNLARAMGGGAAGIMPDDAPKDKYGKPYIIGNLGGVPVNLPPTIVRFVEYTDSPGFNPQALRNFKPSVRTYDSIITSFGFDFRNHDKQMLDRHNDALVEERKQELKAARIESHDWIRVSISAKFANSNPNFLDDSVAHYYERNPHLPHTPIYHYWQPNGEYFHGLQVNIHPGIDPKTGKAWREHEDAKDIFVYRDNEGRVKSIMNCTNKGIINSCTHRFKFPEEMSIFISIEYNRDNLPSWQELEKNAINMVLDFRKDK